MSEQRACHGAETKTVRMACMDYEECRECQTRVRWDLTEHPFFGFQNCEQVAKEPSVDTGTQGGVG